MLLELFLVEERGAVDAGELLAVAVATPVRAGDAQQLECLDLPGARHVRPAAEVEEIALPIGGDGFLAGQLQLVDDLVLEPLVLAVQQFLGLAGRDVVAAEGQILRR